MKSELIPIREAARRLNVSDTAVRKAINAGRVTVAGKNPSNGRPLLAWPDCEQQWHANSDASRRTHVGPTGASKKRQSYASDAPVAPVKAQERQPVSGRQSVPIDHPDDPGGQLEIHDRMNLNEAKTVNEIYKARTAKLDYEKAIGLQVDAAQAQKVWEKHISAAKTRILGIPAACKSRYADLPLAVVAVIEKTCREALEDLANGAG